MKSLLLSICLTSFLIAEEELPEEVKIDPLLSVKEQFSKARKKGWDFSEEQKKSQFKKKIEGLQVELKPKEESYTSEQRGLFFRDNFSEVERMKAIDRNNEMERNLKPPNK